MSTTSIVLVCLTAVVLYTLRREPWRVTYEDESVYDLVREKTSVVVTTFGGESIRGVALESTASYIELGEAAVLGSSGGQVNVRGVMRVPRTNVAYVQDVTSEPLHADTD